MLGSRDLSILEHIIGYCDMISNAIIRFGDDHDVFMSDKDYQNAVALCVLQIGELTINLTDGFKSQYDDMPWHEIRAMRNVVAHDYGSIDQEMLWDTIQSDIPSLKEYCSLILSRGSL